MELVVVCLDMVVVGLHLVEMVVVGRHLVEMVVAHLNLVVVGLHLVEMVVVSWAVALVWLDQDQAERGTAQKVFRQREEEAWAGQANQSDPRRPLAWLPA